MINKNFTGCTGPGRVGTATAMGHGRDGKRKSRYGVRRALKIVAPHISDSHLIKFITDFNYIYYYNFNDLRQVRYDIKLFHSLEATNERFNNIIFSSLYYFFLFSYNLLNTIRNEINVA